MIIDCPKCKASTKRPHCDAGGCPWVTCKRCKLVLDPRSDRTMSDEMD